MDLVIKTAITRTAITMIAIRSRVSSDKNNGHKHQYRRNKQNNVNITGLCNNYTEQYSMSDISNSCIFRMRPTNHDQRITLETNPHKS